MANPLIPQGVLNRALTSLSVVDFPDLNVTTGYFGTKVARMNFEGDASDYPTTLTGGVPSPRLFQTVSITAYLNKSQPLAAQWEQQRLLNTTIGDITVVTDSPTLPPFYFYQCVFMNMPDLDLSGESVDYQIMLRGTYPVNSSLFG